MKITLKGTGILQEYFGKDVHIVELPDKSTVQDLLIKIEEVWGNRFPAYLWDYSEHKFRGPVVLIVDDVVVRDFSFFLDDGAMVHLVKALAGG